MSYYRRRRTGFRRFNYPRSPYRRRYSRSGYRASYRPRSFNWRYGRYRRFR